MFIAELKHSGKYTAKATNSGGEALSLADFAVFEPTPDTMVEVVKTVVYEDARKQETLVRNLLLSFKKNQLLKRNFEIQTSAAGQTKATFEMPQSIPVTISKSQPTSLVSLLPSAKPSLITSESQFSSQSMSSKTEFSSMTETKISQESKTFRLGRATPDISVPQEPKSIAITIEPKPGPPSGEKKTSDNFQVTTEAVSAAQEGIETSSISKQSSLDFFVQKMKQGEEPSAIKEPPKVAPLQPEIFSKFEETETKPAVEPVKLQQAPKLQQYSVNKESKSYQQHFARYSNRAQSLVAQEDVRLVPEPEPEICFAPQRPELPPLQIPVEPLRPAPIIKSAPLLQQRSPSPIYRPQAPISTRPLSPKPSAEAVEMEKLWVPHKTPDVEPSSYTSYSSTEKQTYLRPTTPTGASHEAVAMEKTWAHKREVSSPVHFDAQKSWSVQTTLEKQWKPMVAPEKPKPASPGPVQHYIAKVTDLKEHGFSHSQSEMTSKTESRSEFVLEERNAKPSEIIRSWPPAAKHEDAAPKPVPTSMESLHIRPVSVADITDEIYLEPGPPPEIGYAQPPPRERKSSFAESIEQDLVREPTKVLPCSVRTIPPPLPPKKEKPQAPPLPAKPFRHMEPPKKIIEVVSAPTQRFPELEPFPFHAEPEKPRPGKLPPPPTPSKFVKGRFTDSDYESDFEAAKIPSKWKSCTSDTEDLFYRKVNAGRTSFLQRSKSVDPEPVPPSKFDTLPQTQTPRPPMVYHQKRQEHLTKSAFAKKESTFFPRKEPPPFAKMEPALVLQPGSPPEYLIADAKPKPESPKVKRKLVADGYTADTDEPFKRSEYRHHEYSKQMSESYSSMTTSSTTHHQRFSSDVHPLPSPAPAKVFRKHTPSSMTGKKVR